MGQKGGREETYKNEMRYHQQADSSAIRFSYKSPKLFIGWQLCMYTLGCQFVSRKPTGGQPIPGQHSNCFHKSRILLERGAVRFLVWWLFLHRRLRSGNEAQLALNYLAPFGGSSPKGAARFYSSSSRKSRNLP